MSDGKSPIGTRTAKVRIVDEWKNIDIKDGDASYNFLLELAYRNQDATTGKPVPSDYRDVLMILGESIVSVISKEEMPAMERVKVWMQFMQMLTSHASRAFGVSLGIHNDGSCFPPDHDGCSGCSGPCDCDDGDDDEEAAKKLSAELAGVVKVRKDQLN